VLLILRYVFLVILIGVLLAAVVMFAVLGLARVVRAHRLARGAHERGMRFFPTDGYDVPRRYADFAVISCGHSPRASNMMAGRLDGAMVRCFDYHCELGHGPRRTSRLLRVLAAEVAAEVAAPTVMWHESDADLAPLEARGQRRIGPWACSGDLDLAEAIASQCPTLASKGASIELRAGGVMLCVPGGLLGRGAALDVEDARPIVRELRRRNIEKAAAEW
jgi:hypothetical protein